MTEKTIWDSIREIASILQSIYSIILIIGIVSSVVIQIYPYLSQQWVSEIGRIVTPILIAILISYILINRANSRISKELETSGHYYAVHSQALFFALTDLLKPSGEVEDLRHIINAIKELDKIWISSGTQPLTGVPRQNLVGVAISFAKKWNIPFEILCSFLVQNLGKERAKRLVAPRDVLKYYGKDCLSTWNELTK